MVDLSSDINNTPKTVLQGGKNRAENDIGSTIECDVRSCQVKTTIVKCKKGATKRIEI